jgi:hypothetical protein
MCMGSCDHKGLKDMQCIVQDDILHVTQRVTAFSREVEDQHFRRESGQLPKHSLFC